MSFFIQFVTYNLDEKQVINPEQIIQFRMIQNCTEMMLAKKLN